MNRTDSDLHGLKSKLEPLAHQCGFEIRYEFEMLRFVPIGAFPTRLLAIEVGSDNSSYENDFMSTFPNNYENKTLIISHLTVTREFDKMKGDSVDILWIKKTLRELADYAKQVSEEVKNRPKRKRVAIFKSSGSFSGKDLVNTLATNLRDK